MPISGYTYSIINLKIIGFKSILFNIDKIY